MVTSTARPYKVYTAILTQSGTNAPVATVLGDNTIGNIVWSRVQTGNYQATLTNAFSPQNTTVFITPSHINFPTTITAYVTNNNIINITCADDSGTLTDSRIILSSIEIKVY
jgi:hypothetical protein